MCTQTERQRRGRRCLLRSSTKCLTKQRTGSSSVAKRYRCSFGTSVAADILLPLLQWRRISRSHPVPVLMIRSAVNRPSPRLNYEAHHMYRDVVHSMDAATPPPVCPSGPCVRRFPIPTSPHLFEAADNKMLPRLSLSLLLLSDKVGRRTSVRLVIFKNFIGL